MRRRLPRSTLALGRGLALGPCLALLLAGCDSTPGVPPSEPIAEPEEALRPASQRGHVPDDARVIDYRIDARLNAEDHEIEGTVVLTWKNTTRRAVDFMPFHLYMNAFRASDTRWMSAARGSFRGDELGDDAWGYVDVRSVRALEGDRLADPEVGSRPGQALTFAEQSDPSLMVVELPREVGPGETVTLELDFLTRLPRVFARTGYADDFHFAGQWFPKPGVLEEARGWQAHEFTAWSEFYADFGDYEVHLDVPERMVVGATGIRTAEEIVDGRKRLTYNATLVHDFAWVADPDLVEHWGEYNGIRIRQLLAPEYAQDAEVHMDAQRWTLESMEARFGPYPWSTITIVHPPPKASGAGGMEYPTLYTTGGRATRPGAPPTWLLEERFSGIFVTVHEFGHQFFQGLVATNEHDQPWLDEGVNTFANYLAYEDAYGENPWVARILDQPIRLHDFARLSNSSAADTQEIDKAASGFEADGGAYGSTAYSKAAAVLYTLRAVAGPEAFDRGMRAFVDRTRFGHPTGRELEMILREFLGDRVLLTEPGPGAVSLDVADYLDQALRSTRTVGFEVGRIRTRRQVVKDGFYRHEHDGASSLHRHYPPTGGHEPAFGEGGEDGEDGEGQDDARDARPPLRTLDDEAVESSVEIIRSGDFQLPVDVLVRFTSGDPELVVWDGRARTTTLRFPGRRIQRVDIDPLDKLILERRRLDNSRSAPSSALPRGATPQTQDVGDMMGTIVEGLATSLLHGGVL